MLYPWDPLCSSSKISETRADEKKPEQLKLQETDPEIVSFGETQTPNFCIRDYVFASRSKSNGSSWPFRHGLLKLCLKHGVRDPLPPFEPARSVRDIFCRASAAELEKNINPNLSQFVGEICLLNGEHNPTRTVSCSPSNEEDKVHNLINEDYEIRSTLTNRSYTERLSLQLGESPVEKKCSLILNSGVISETSRAEEIASNSTASDLMASKICPVCKTFSSTSNTTLNAHMDQCLSMASDAATNVDKIQKLVLKPMKKRLMEDIYATALHCSLEDLDRRNGTSWATDLSLVIPLTEANSEVKKLKLSQVDDADYRSEGAVYVDSNGVKVRILSKFNDSPQVISKKVFRSSKDGNLVRDGKISLISQKKHFVGEKCSKKMKLKIKNKKLTSLKLLENEAEPEIAHDNEGSRREDEGSADQLSNDQEQEPDHVSFGTTTLQKWHCSKRSDLPKKICKKNFLKNMENPYELVTQITNPEKGNSASANNPPQNMANEVKSSHGFSSKSTSSTNALRLRFSKRSKNGDFFLGRKQKSLDFPETYGRPTENCNLSPKTKKISTLSKSNFSPKLLRKHKRKREIFSYTNEEQQRCVEPEITSFSDEEIIDASLNSGSCQCHDSLMQTENMGGPIIAKSPSPLLDSDDKTSKIMSMKECEISIERVFGKQDEETSQIGATSTESSACLTSHGDFGRDTPREYFYTASAPVIPNQESNLIIHGEPSGSPVSISSISPAAHGHLGRSMADKEGAQALDIDQNQQCKIESTMNKQSDHHPCCCSRQSIMAGIMPTSKPKLIPNLHIRSNPAYSIFHTDTGNIASLESPTGSAMTTSPSCGTPSQSCSNSILRLMGKNLMVTHNEDSPSKDSRAGHSLPSPLSFTSYLSAPNHESFPFAAPLMTDIQARNSVRRGDDMKMRGTLLPVPLSHTMFQGPYSYFLPQQNQILLREIGSSSNSSYLIGEASSFEVPAAILPRPFLLRPPSATHLNPPLFYPQTLR